MVRFSSEFTSKINFKIKKCYYVSVIGFFRNFSLYYTTKLKIGCRNVLKIMPHKPKIYLKIMHWCKYAFILSLLINISSYLVISSVNSDRCVNDNRSGNKPSVYDCRGFNSTRSLTAFCFHKFPTKKDTFKNPTDLIFSMHYVEKNLSCAKMDS